MVVCSVSQPPNASALTSLGILLSQLLVGLAGEAINARPEEAAGVVTMLPPSSTHILQLLSSAVASPDGKSCWQVRPAAVVMCCVRVVVSLS